MGLIKLATYAIVGYAAYAIIRDVMESQSQGGSMRSGGRAGRRSGRSQMHAGAEGSGAARMSGPAGERGGREEQTSGTEGGSTTHRVGRGVVGT
jgi:hypothetical protein